MKRLHTHKLLFIAFAVVLVFGLSSCSDDETPVPSPVVPPLPTNALVSMPITATPSEDATVDAFWANIPGFDIATEVPAYDFMVSGEDIWWDNYEGNTANLTLKSAYDDTYIYLLAQWDDPNESTLREAWYYYTGATPAESEWLQMGKKHPDVHGNPPAYEDKFAMFWDMTVAAFPTTGCGPLCHGQYMGTNGAGEKMDIWHWKRCRTAPVNQLDDKWLDDAQNGRHSDAGTGAYASNKHVINTANTGNQDMTVPEYWIPGRQSYDWIMASEIASGVARLIVDVDASGNLVDEDGTVLDRTQFGYNSNLVIPSLKEIKPATGSRGDVSAWHNWSNGTWTLKIKRLRDTGNSDDIQFTQLNTDYWFSVGIMNAAAIAHATPGGWSATAYRMVLYK